MSEQRPTVHMWGFFDEEGRPCTPNGAAVSWESPAVVTNRVLSNVEHFGAEVVDRHTTRTLDGWCVGANFVTLPRETAAQMWHRIERASDDWPAKSNPAAEVTR